MASGKKGAKGNKTAHVLNLLTAPGEAPPASAGESAGDTPASETAQPAGRPLLPPILEVAQANDNQLAQQIQQALEEELEGDTAPAPAPEPPAPSGGKMSQDDIEKMLASMGAPAEEPEPAPAPEPPAPSGGKMSQDDIEKMLASMGAPAEEPAPAPVMPPAPKAPEKPIEEDVTYINVMQTLVEEKALRYIKMFGLCDCKRCQADVKALTLSNLVPKYVVLSSTDRIPMLTVYEGRFNSTVVAQLTRSCKIVMDSPRHDR